MRFLVLIIALIAAPFARADELKSPDAAVALTDRVMERVAAGDLRGGLTLAKPYTIVPEAEFESMVGQAELQAPMMAARFGRSFGYELIRNDSVGGSLMQVVQLHKFEKHATVWRFIFYSNGKGWVLNSFKYSDDISTVL